MAFEDLWKVFNVKNSELKFVADFAHKCAVNTMREQSAGLSVGMTTHALERQATWITNCRARLAALNEHPIPDLPAVHPTEFVCDYSEVPEIITAAGGQPLNSDVLAVATAWSTFFNEFCRSNSAGLAGGMLEFDYKRAEQNLDSIMQVLDSITRASSVDFPETAEPEAKAARPGLTRSR